MRLLGISIGLSILGSLGGILVASSFLLLGEQIRVRLVPWLISYAVGTLIGISLLYLVNLARVLSLIAIGVLARGWFDVAHLYVWQALFFAVVAGCWFGWILRLPAKT